jgi:hypothetical protein
LPTWASLPFKWARKLSTNVSCLFYNDKLWANIVLYSFRSSSFCWFTLGTYSLPIFVRHCKLIVYS